MISKKGKAISIKGHGKPRGCETSRLPHFLDIQVTDGDEFVSINRQSHFTFRKTPGIDFC
jgi:hypothetical protein